MFIWRNIKYQLYLLQLENYELPRYFKLLFKKGLWPKGEQRKDLVWTAKARVIFLLALLLHFLVPVAFYGFSAGGLLAFSIKYLALSIIIFAFLSAVYCLLYTVSLILLYPFDWLAKKIIVVRAKSKIKNLKPQIKIIGIAGSYGKTTIKEVLGAVLGTQFSVLGTPESVNTPVGIARWILKSVADNTEILIVEMGEHYRGDVADICEIAKPDIAVVTGINEAHLERMKTLENITATVFEIVASAQPGALVVLNGDDKNVMGHYKEFIWPDHKLAVYGQQNLESRIKNQEFNPERVGWEAEFEGLGKIFINLLGEYALGDVGAAIQIARHLNLSEEKIRQGIAKIKPVEHRLQPIKSSGDILVIDDSYNGNPEGVKEAIKVLARFAGRRKLFITPGLVETGKAAAEIHREIGRQLAGVADVVILIKNSVTPWIEEGINSVIARSEATKQSDSEIDRHDHAGLAMTKVIWFNSAPEAHAALGKILKPNDVILFQNDWGDQYI